MFCLYCIALNVPWFDLITYRIIECHIIAVLSSLKTLMPLILPYSLENNSWETNDIFELKILYFNPLVAKVWNPSEGLMQANLKQSICIHSSCVIISKLFRVTSFTNFSSIGYPVCFTAFSYFAIGTVVPM